MASKPGYNPLGRLTTRKVGSKYSCCEKGQTFPEHPSRMAGGRVRREIGTLAMSELRQLLSSLHKHRFGGLRLLGSRPPAASLYTSGDKHLVASAENVPEVAMGQNPVPPVNIPIPTKIPTKMGGAPTPKWDPKTVLTHSHMEVIYHFRCSTSLVEAILLRTLYSGSIKQTKPLPADQHGFNPQPSGFSPNS